jgi:membrane-bound lytic murein transglycosylase B
MLLIAQSPVAAQETPTITDEDRAAFSAWLKDFRNQAQKTGISEQTLNAALGYIAPNPKVIRANEYQPEFSKQIWDYLDTALSETRVDNGKTLLAENADLFAEIEAAYGVQGHYIAAIWGLESSYGALTGGYNVMEALATLGFRGRRMGYGRTQLMAALQIAENGDKAPSEMTGSWAGAMGQTQFIPTTYLSHARDHDGDGHRDIWDNLGDVFASTANYLAASGWTPQQTWGREVMLPEGFDYTMADRNVRKPMTAWSEMNVTFTNGTPLPKLDRVVSIILPGGHKGPAFMIQDNFRTTLRYNNSTAYALAVGLLAEQLLGGEAVQGTWPRDERALSLDEKKEFQSLLTAAGYDTKGIDGILGANSRNALRSYQIDRGLVPDGFATASLLEVLRPAQTAPE